MVKLFTCVYWSASIWSLLRELAPDAKKNVSPSQEFPLQSNLLLCCSTFSRSIDNPGALRLNVFEGATFWLKFTKRKKNPLLPDTRAPQTNPLVRGTRWWIPRAKNPPCTDKSQEWVYLGARQTKHRRLVFRRIKGFFFFGKSALLFLWPPLARNLHRSRRGFRCTQDNRGVEHFVWKLDRCWVLHNGMNCYEATWA